jgi:hypothetical protein
MRLNGIVHLPNQNPTEIIVELSFSFLMNYHRGFVDVILTDLIGHRGCSIIGSIPIKFVEMTGSRNLSGEIIEYLTITIEIIINQSIINFIAKDT